MFVEIFSAYRWKKKNSLKNINDDTEPGPEYTI